MNYPIILARNLTKNPVEACFLHRMLLKMRRVHQKPFFSTECIFRTPGVPLWYRIQRQKIGKALRKEIPMYPPIAIREFVANALIHQDFYLGGSSPMIEIFGNRMEISNPGKPLIDIFRFIDHTPISRNEKLASLMRRMNICEERGCGVDRAITQCELYQLPAPDFQKDDLFTKVIMYAPMTLRQMDKKDKRRACYQHCCLQYLSGQKMTNESFRGRLNISNENYSMASRIIADTISVGYIKPDEAASSKKYAKYVPFWA